MREIKFRGKTPQGEWVYGDLAKIDGKYNILTNPIKWIDGLEFSIDGEYEIIPETIGQFTGLKDANGVDIYEGDIVEYKRFSGSICRHYISTEEELGRYVQVLISNETNKGLLLSSLSQDDFDEIGKIIVGNIHDNPELIKE